MKETYKNIVIAVLICSLLLLASAALPTRSIASTPWLSRLVQPIAPFLGLTEAELTHVQEAAAVTDAAQPIAISINNAAGRCSAMWDFAALDTAFDALSPVLAQAMEQAGSFMAVSQLQVQTALTKQSVFFQYAKPLPSHLLASWLDADLQAAVPETETCILSSDGSTVSLYMLGAQSYCAKTALPAEALTALIEGYAPDGSQFAFEAGLALAPLSLLPGGTPAVPAFSVSNPCDSRYINALATDLGFNPYAETRYTDDQGVTHFSETNASLEISSGGLIRLRTEGNRYRADSTDPQVLAETARQLTARLLDSVPGEGRLYLSSFVQEGDATICSFDYVVSGVPVDLGTPAGKVYFASGAVTEVSLQLYGFSGTGRMLYPLPIAQAVAVLPAASPLELAYCIGNDLTLSAGWLR